MPWLLYVWIYTVCIQIVLYIITYLLSLVVHMYISLVNIPDLAHLDVTTGGRGNA